MAKDKEGGKYRADRRATWAKVARGLHVALKVAVTCEAENAIKYTPFAVTLQQNHNPHSHTLHV